MYLIRHGHRSDHGTLKERQATTNPADPFLTDIGAMQAFLTGETLYREIEYIKTKRILLISSPYLRCLQTSESLLNGLQKFNINLAEEAVFVEDALREFQESPPFKPTDYQTISFFNTDQIIYPATRYNSLEMFKDIRHATAPFPESDDDMNERFNKVFEAVRCYLLNPANADVVVVLVTHGIFITEAYSKFFGQKVEEYRYCSTSNFSVEPSTGNWRVNYIDQRRY